MVWFRPWKIDIIQFFHPKETKRKFSDQGVQVTAQISVNKKLQRSFQKFWNQSHHTELRDKVVKGTPSSIFQILAEPSVEVEARNSESRLQCDKNEGQYSKYPCNQSFRIKMFILRACSYGLKHCIYIIKLLQATQDNSGCQFYQLFIRILIDA
jgi:hypothetical protein